MPSTYHLIRDTIPHYHSFDAGLIWDPVRPYVYINGRNNTSGFGNGNSFLYKYDRISESLALTQQTGNQWAPYGSMAVDRQGRIYFTPPGGTTHSIQHSGSFDQDLKLIAKAEKRVSSSCTTATNVAGDYITDQYNQSAYWWHVDASDLFSGSITCFHKDEYCTVVNPNSLAPLWKYSVPQTLFQSPGGFFSTGYKVRAYCADAGGTMWVYVAGPDAGSVTRYYLWQVDTNGNVSFEYDLTPVIQDLGSFAGNATQGRMRYFKQDGSLIISNGRTYLKYMPGSGVTNTLLIPPVTLAHFLPTAGVWYAGTNRTSFRHPDDRVLSIWIADYLINTNPPSDLVVVPPGGWEYFPMFTEIKMEELTIGQVLVSYEVGLEYPLHVINPTETYTFFNPSDALIDPETGKIWATSSTRRIIGVFDFDLAEVPPNPPPGPGPIIAPFCVPKNVDVVSSQVSRASSQSSSAVLDPEFSNFKKL